MKKLFTILFLFSIFISSAKSVFATQAGYSCTPAVVSKSVGDNVSVDIVLDARNFQIMGGEALLTYDTAKLTPNSTQVQPVTTATGWTAPIKNTIDTSLGKIDLDYGASQSAFKSQGTIGTVSFKVKDTGQAQINFIYFQAYDASPGVSTAWGNREVGKLSNVLTDATNCMISIGAGGPTASPTALPRTGSMSQTITLMTLGGMFVLASLFFFKTLL